MRLFFFLSLGPYPGPEGWSNTAGASPHYEMIWWLEFRRVLFRSLMINFFSKYKFIFYLFNFFLIILYLYPGSLLGCFLYDDCKLQPQITADFIVSTNHLYAFVLFSIIGYLTFNKSSQFIFLTFYLIFLSIILEILHYVIPERSMAVIIVYRNKYFFLF